jgi:hypothetical protein
MYFFKRHDSSKGLPINKNKSCDVLALGIVGQEGVGIHENWE